MLRAVSILLILQILGHFNPILAQNGELSLNTVVIDAGHGGRDPGTLIGDLKEKDIVLDVALKTGNLIKKNYPNVKVIYTRDTDVFVPLKQRAEIANKAKADLFISIHVNYFQQANTYGTETYILGNHRSEENLKVAQMENSVILLEDDYQTRYEGFDPNSAESYIMFELIQDEFLEQSRMFADKVQTNFVEVAKRRSRGVRQAGFLVLRETVMPSILIELGFISNPKEKQYLMTSTGRSQLAQSIYTAFSDYKKKFDDKSTSGIISHENEAPPQPISAENNDNKIIDIAQLENGKTWYAVQIAASSNKLQIDNELFSGLQSVYEFKENGWYKYYSGITQDKGTARQIRSQLSNKYQGAFLVSFTNGKKGKF